MCDNGPVARSRSDPPANPFRFGALALDEAFTDRDSEIAELTADIRNGQDVVVIAPRRVGKSSLIRRVAQDLASEGILVAQMDLMRTPTKERFAAKLAQAIHEQIASPVEQVRDRLRVFRALRLTPNVSVNPENGAFAFSFDARAEPGDLDATLEELLALPGRIGAERGRRVALVLDEFQEVVEIDPGLIKLMRSVFQEQPDVAHVYLGSRRDMMQRIFDDQNEPFWRSAKQMPLRMIPINRFSRYAEARFDATGKAIAPEACAAVMRMTGGHPNATQELLYTLWETVPAGATAQPDDLAEALARLLRAENAHFSLVWEHATTAQRLVLQALAAEQPGRPLGGDYQRRHALPRTPTVQTALDALIAQELVRRVSRGEYRISEPFLTEWIRQNES